MAFELDIGNAYPIRGTPTSDSAKRVVRARSRGICERCNDQPAREFHHRTYAHHGHELAQELEHLCRDCHQAIHFDVVGNFWLDEDEKRAHWATYENEKECG